MTIPADNKFLQGDVEFIIGDALGTYASNVPHRILSHDIADAVATDTAFVPAEFVVYDGTDQGVNKLTAATVLADLMGVVPYQVSGIIDDSGYRKPMYTNLPIAEMALIKVGVAPASAVITYDTVIALYVDPAAPTTYGKVVNADGGVPGGAINISTLARAKQPSADGVVLISLDIK